jgi:hypothetical protein|uniref:hypothetical protein n=1 Tax=Cephaloticoccus sp. TaxID=1985742 RepID=UPI00404B5171
MTIGGWISMFLSVGFVTTLFLYCIIRVLRGPGTTPDHTLGHIEPVDESESDQR